MIYAKLCKEELILLRRVGDWVPSVTRRAEAVMAMMLPMMIAAIPLNIYDNTKI